MKQTFKKEYFLILLSLNDLKTQQKGDKNKMKNKIKQFFKGLFNKKIISLKEINQLNKRGLKVYF